LSHNGASDNPYLYTGQQFDALTGLYSLRARYYDPALGRFLSRDPAKPLLTAPHELNRYVYVADNPLNAADPSGRFAAVEYSMANSTMVRSAAATVVFAGSVYLFLKAVAGMIETQEEALSWQRLLALEARQSVIASEEESRPTPYPPPPLLWTPIPPTPTPCGLPAGRYPNIPVISLATLLTCRPEASTTLALILSNGPFPFKRDDAPFFNDRGYLPPPSDRSRSSPTGYREYTVLTPGLPGSGPRRIVTFGPINRLASQYTMLYYTDDHYSTFAEVR